MSTLTALVANSGDGTISTFRINDGGLYRTAVTEIGDGVSTFSDPAFGSRFHAGVKAQVGDTEGPAIVTLGLDDQATISILSAAGVGDSMTYLTHSPAHTHLLGVSYSGGFGAVWPIDGDRLGPQSARVEYPNAHSVITTRDARHAYICSLGADVLGCFELTSDGHLTSLGDSPAPAGSGPRHIVLSADEQHAYVITEFSGEALHYRRDADGRLAPADSTAAHATDRGLSHSELGADPLENHHVWGADLHLGADGRFLWCSERTESTIVTIPVHSDGSLGEARHCIDTELQPRGFAVSPDGSWVLVAGELSTTVSLYAIRDDGRLVLSDSAETGRKANWVRFV